MRVPTLDGFQNQLAMLSQQYQIFNQLLQQQSTQKKLLYPSDDPILSSQIEDIQAYMGNMSVYDQNNTLADNRVSMLESAAKSGISIVDQIKQLMVQASNDTNSDSGRTEIANQLQGLLNSIVGISNRMDGPNYIFSGNNTGSAAYVLTNGKYVFQGTQDSSSINIGPNNDVIYNQSGFAIFDHLFSGNGVFAINAASGNTGTASTSIGSVTDQSAYVADTYTISFLKNTAGDLVYQVTGASSGQVIPAPPATIPDQAPVFNANNAISFNGVTFTVSGQPNAGDSFQLAPSTSDNIFNDLQSYINVLSIPQTTSTGDVDPAKRAQFHQAHTQARATIDTFFNNLVSFQSDTGQRKQSIANQISLNTEIQNNNKINISSLGDADPVEIQASLSNQIIYIQAVLSSYKQLESVLGNLIDMI